MFSQDKLPKIVHKEFLLYLCMIIHKYSDIVGLGYLRVRDEWFSSLSVNVDTRSAKRGVSEVTMMNTRLTSTRYT